MFSLRHIHACAAGAALFLVILAPGAAAAPTCEYDAATRVLHVEIGTAETARVGNFLGAIVVQEGDAAFVDCAGPLATVENTDEVEVLDRAGGGAEHLVLSRRPSSSTAPATRCSWTWTWARSPTRCRHRRPGAHRDRLRRHQPRRRGGGA